MVCETGKVSGMASVVADQKARIQNQEENKAQQAKLCTSTYDFYESAFTAYRRASSEAHSNELTKRQMQKKLEDLQTEMKLAIANATKNGDTTKANSLRIYYENAISTLQLNITSFENADNTQDALKAATEAKDSAKANWNGATNWFMEICHSLFNDYLSLGKYEDMAALEQQASERLPGTFDQTT